MKMYCPHCRNSGRVRKHLLQKEDIEIPSLFSVGTARPGEVLYEPETLKVTWWTCTGCYKSWFL